MNWQGPILRVKIQDDAMCAVVITLCPAILVDIAVAGMVASEQT